MYSHVQDAKPLVPPALSAEQAPAFGNGKPRREWTLAWKIGHWINRSLSRLSQVQQRTLVMASLLLLASYFVFVVSKGFGHSIPESRQDRMLPNAPAQPQLEPIPSGKDAKTNNADSASIRECRP